MRFNHVICLLTLLALFSGCGNREDRDLSAYPRSTPEELFQSIHEGFEKADAPGWLSLMSRDQLTKALENIEERLKEAVEDPEMMENLKKNLKTDEDPTTLDAGELYQKIIASTMNDENLAEFNMTFGKTFIGTTKSNGMTVIIAEAPIDNRGDDAITKKRIELVAVMEKDGWAFDENKSRELRKKPSHEIKTGSDELKGLAVSTDSSRIAALYSGSDKVTVWEMKDYNKAHELSIAGAKPIESTLFSPGLDLVAAFHEDGVVRIWDVKTGQSKKELAVEGGAVRPLAFSPGGKLLAATDVKTKGTLVLLDASSLKEQQRFTAHAELINAVVFSPDGKWIATASDDTMIKVWDTTSGKRRITLAGHRKPVFCVAFSPDGKRLVSSSNSPLDENKGVIVWDIASVKQLYTISGYKEIRSSMFTPDGNGIVCVGPRFAVILDLLSGTELRLIDAGAGFGDVLVAISPDGRFIAMSAGYVARTNIQIYKTRLDTK